MDTTLGAFLQSRRARLRPDDFGLTTFGRRRVPGLRREEVAQLAGISVDYYARLEQSRDLNVSKEVLAAVARVLRLDQTERAHLYTLARAKRDDERMRQRNRLAGDEPVPSGLRLMLESLGDAPGVVVGPRMNVLASNPLGAAIHYFGCDPHGRDMAVRFFLDPAARSFFPDWPAVAAESVAFLRLQAGRRPGDQQLADLIEELSTKSSEFRELWNDHGVQDKESGTKRMNHPVVGELVLHFETLTVPGYPDLVVIIYAAAPGSTTAERLRTLAAWAASNTVTADGGWV